MAALSIVLSNELALASQKAAKKLGVTRTQFIRLAIIHELNNFEAEQEQQAMAGSMLAMKKSKKYLQESEELSSKFNDPLPDDGDEWWIKK